jgi:uncharacterized SAM-binding protein YcdF (DUF218 family)
MEFAFILKKVISAMVMPLSIGLFLAIIGLILLYSNRLKSAKIFLTFSIVWIALISYVPFSNLLIKPLETSYQKLEKIPTDIKYILLLGGDMENRAWEALHLYNQIPNAKIITSGYAGRANIPEAIKTANILYAIGIKKEDIIIHKEPKDTKEEAIKIKQLLNEERFFLVTSAYHMPRAMALFQKEGLNPIAAPTDLKIKDSDKAFSVPSGSSLKKTETAWHEYLGTLWAKLRGQID